MQRLARFLVRHYPRAWRERYEDELLALLEEDPAGVLSVLDLVRGLVRQRLIEAFRWRPGEQARLGMAGLGEMLALLGLGVLLSLIAMPAASWAAARGLHADPNWMAVVVVFPLAAPLRWIFAMMARRGSEWRWTLVGDAELALWCAGFFAWCVACFLPHVTTTGLVVPAMTQPLFYVAVRGTQLQLFAIGTRRQFLRTERLQALQQAARAARLAKLRAEPSGLDLSSPRQ
jgi:hypothetical protein